MTIYVDDMRHHYRRLILSHMIADTDEELHHMAQRIGVAHRWFQGDHYDVCQEMKAKAIVAGAVQIKWMQASAMIQLRAATKADLLPPPNEAYALYRQWRKDHAQPNQEQATLHDGLQRRLSP